MKNTFTTILSLLVLTMLSSCFSSEDDSYLYQEIPTNFNKDISNVTNFYLSTPVELKVNNGTIINDTLYFKVGDTIKLQMDLNAVYEEAPNERYDLLKSTKSTSFYLNIFAYNYYGDRNYIDPDFIDLNFLEKYPEIKSLNLSREETLSSAIYKELYVNSAYLDAKYNETTKKYSFSVGLIANKATGVNTSINAKNTIVIDFSEHISSKVYNYYYGQEEDITISIPVISTLLNRHIIIEP